MMKQIKDNPKISTSKALSGSMKNFINNNIRKVSPILLGTFCNSWDLIQILILINKIASMYHRKLIC